MHFCDCNITPVYGWRAIFMHSVFMAKNDIIFLCHLIGNPYMCISENLIFYFKWYFWNQFASIIAFKFWLAQVSDKQQQVFFWTLQRVLVTAMCMCLTACLSKTCAGVITWITESDFVRSEMWRVGLYNDVSAVTSACACPCVMMTTNHTSLYIEMHIAIYVWQTIHVSLNEL